MNRREFLGVAGLAGLLGYVTIPEKSEAKPAECNHKTDKEHLKITTENEVFTFCELCGRMIKESEREKQQGWHGLFSQPKNEFGWEVVQDDRLRIKSGLEIA